MVIKYKTRSTHILQLTIFTKKGIYIYIFIYMYKLLSHEALSTTPVASHSRSKFPVVAKKKKKEIN